MLTEPDGPTGNATLQAAADRLAGFLARIQAKSTKLPGWPRLGGHFVSLCGLEPALLPAEFDGAFFRAFDFVKWEVWGSDADLGWGAWSIETGWTQVWQERVPG